MPCCLDTLLRCSAKWIIDAEVDGEGDYLYMSVYRRALPSSVQFDFAQFDAEQPELLYLHQLITKGVRDFAVHAPPQDNPAVTGDSDDLDADRLVSEPLDFEDVPEVDIDRMRRNNHPIVCNHVRELSRRPFPGVVTQFLQQQDAPHYHDLLQAESPPDYVDLFAFAQPRQHLYDEWDNSFKSLQPLQPLPHLYDEPLQPLLLYMPFKSQLVIEDISSVHVDANCFKFVFSLLDSPSRVRFVSRSLSCIFFVSTDEFQIDMKSARMPCLEAGLIWNIELVIGAVFVDSRKEYQAMTQYLYVYTLPNGYFLTDCDYDASDVMLYRELELVPRIYVGGQTLQRRAA